MASKSTPAASQVATLARGITLVCGDTETALPPAATQISADPGAVSAWPDASVDCVVALAGLDLAYDPVQTLRAWRRVLKEDGTLVLGDGEGAPRLSLAFQLSLVQLVGGFETVASASPPLTLVRRRVAEIRAPLAGLGPAMAAAASQSTSCRAELLFQIGTVLLQCGEASLACACFEGVLQQEPGSAEGHFGLGMAHAAGQRWKNALCELECARRLNPDNSELQRWLDLARAQVDSPAASAVHPPQAAFTLPAAVPAKWSPAPVPAPVRTGPCLRL